VDYGEAADKVISWELLGKKRPAASGTDMPTYQAWQLLHARATETLARTPEALAVLAEVAVNPKAITVARDTVELALRRAADEDSAFAEEIERLVIDLRGEQPSAHGESLSRYDGLEVTRQSGQPRVATPSQPLEPAPPRPRSRGMVRSRWSGGRKDVGW